MDFTRKLDEDEVKILSYRHVDVTKALNTLIDNELKSCEHRMISKYRDTNKIEDSTILAIVLDDPGFKTAATVQLEREAAQDILNNQ